MAGLNNFYLFQCSLFKSLSYSEFNIELLMLIMILDRYSLFGLPGMLNWLEFSYIRSRDRVVEGRFCYGDRTIAGFEPNGLNNCSTTEFLV
jgi:hypothetical protein